MYKRTIREDVEKWLSKGKIVIIYGARQVGKTTLVKQIAKKYRNSKYYDCDFSSVREKLGRNEKSVLSGFVKDYDLVVFDEAQRVKNIGLSLKIIHDHFPGKKIIATGSSSFDLSNRTKEPLTGRAMDCSLYPLSVKELTQKEDRFEIDAGLEEILVYGQYPGIYGKNKDDKSRLLLELAEKYLYKDILEFENIKKSDVLHKLLQLLALQIGSEVSLPELSNGLGVSKITVEKYIDLLEKAFVIKRVGSFARNLRKEINKNSKIYFYDSGIRNALINNFNRLAIRDDTGALWENFIVMERLKKQAYAPIYANNYFWRTYDKKEIDWVEEREGKLFGYEIKWGDKKVKEPKLWRKTYDNAEYKVINRDNYLEFIL